MDITASEIDEYFAFASTIAKEAGKVISNAYYKEKAIETKAGVADLVTKSDKEVEKLLFDSIRSKFPSHKLIGEESVSAGDVSPHTNDPTWIIDPIDGTTNFVHRFPYVAVCIGFTCNKVIKFGVVYNPILDELYTAKRGTGAFLNGTQIHVSQEPDLRKCLVMTECGSSRDGVVMEKLFENMQSVLSTPVHTIHSLGSAAMNACMVAKGAAEAYYEFGPHCWDFCAAGIIVEEAGGVLMNGDGGPFDLMARQIIAANNTEVGKSLAKRLVQQISFPHDCQ